MKLPFVLASCALGLTALVLAGEDPARADRDIVFAAQYYRWSGHFYKDEYSSAPEQTLTDLGTTHLYRINPDGSGRTQVTSGHYCDRQPHWSPDGRFIAFLRSDEDYVHERLCVVPADGGTVRTLVRKRGREDYFNRHPAWSPDSKHIAVVQGDKAVLVVTVNTGHVRRYAGAFNFAWSPDGKCLFLCMGDSWRGTKHSDRVVSLATEAMIRASVPISDPSWIAPDIIVGTALRDNALQTLRRDGTAGRRLPVLLADKEGVLGPDGGRWIALPHRRSWLLYEQDEHVSDGEHYTCYLVNTQTGSARELRPGLCAGISPDGSSVAVADSDWIGPYKRGGRRCGPLEVVSVQTGRARPITSRLVTILGGDWRKPPPTHR